MALEGRRRRWVRSGGAFGRRERRSPGGDRNGGYVRHTPPLVPNSPKVANNLSKVHTKSRPRTGGTLARPTSAPLRFWGGGLRSAGASPRIGEEFELKVPGAEVFEGLAG